ncbi:GT-D fold domain-containing protein [Effusibacillus pohliae]|uniref:GT-D fold domain-containing protein n=1 Tax=Effusibacillus pohliae TaxID=232270 RepID=UPI00035E9260|nr:GT-D fold domain-containing glycosyltransferase [Effusibacillus pohliae]
MNTSDRTMLSTEQVIQFIDQAVCKKVPFCLVRVGDGENIVLAQRFVMPINRVLKTRWGRLSQKTNRKGIRLPNERARDQMIEALKRADLVGIPHYEERELLAPQKYLRPLTDQCFKKYGIRPQFVCHTLVNRHLVEKKSFWEMLQGRRVAVISKWADPFAKLVEKEYGDFDIQIVARIPFSHYDQIDQTVREMKRVKCDIVLISAGVNAVILAEKLAREQGRVAIDFGKSAMFMVKRNARIRPWRGEPTT